MSSDSDSEHGAFNIRDKSRSYGFGPIVILQSLYQYLTLSDMYKMQLVCKQWEKTKKYSFEWKHCPLTVKQLDVGLAAQQLGKEPFLYGIKSRAHCENGEKLVDAIVNSLVDLREMKVRFVPPVSATDIHKLAEKFSMLESITLNISADDVIDSLEILRNSLNLREIKFFSHDFQLDYLLRVSNICKTLAEGFTHIDKLNICYFQVTSADKDILFLLEKKMDQLKCFKLSCHENVSPDIFRIIFDSSTLEVLNLKLWNRPTIPLHLQKMESLKSLIVKSIGSDCHHVVGCRCKDVSETITQLALPSSLEKVVLQLDNFGNFRCGVAEKVISTSQNLTYLQLCNIPDPDIDHQLVNIGTLKHLHTLILEHCKHLSSESVKHISEGKNLRNLVLSDVTLTDTAFQFLSKCTYLNKLVLRRCDLRIRNLMPMILALIHLTQLFVCGCCDRSSGQIHYIDDRILQLIARECKRQKRDIYMTWNVPHYPSIFNVT